MAFAVISAIFFLLATHTRAASIEPDASNPKAIGSVINSFSIKLLADTLNISGGSFNLALSPYTIWTLLNIIHEGARNHTAEELETVLGLPSCEQQSCKEQFRRSYRTHSSLLSAKARDVVVSLSNGFFVEDTVQLNPDFEGVSRNAYDVNVMPIDFTNKETAAKNINHYLAEKTGQYMNNFVNAGDLEGTNIFLTSALYFKGFWQTPFNKSLTKKEMFFNEQRKPIGEVDMMYLKTPLPFTPIFYKKASAVELKYGDGDRISMVVIVPKWNSSLSEILTLLINTPLNNILEALTLSAQQFLDDDVVVHLPKFKIQSDFVMNSVLDTMGIKDLFNVEKANLLGISTNKDFYVSRVVQRAVIHVDEDGTVAAAAAGASIANKSPPGEIKANRPFAYLIVDKPTQTLLIVGTVQNPVLG